MSWGLRNGSQDDSVEQIKQQFSGEALQAQTSGVSHGQEVAREAHEGQY
jgi:hypothetical protein